jgi:ABC-type nitrate/sulfonate/bicarbonate transport system permease component
MTRTRRVVAVWGPPLLLFAALIAFWEAWTIVRHSPSYVLPSPGRVAGAFGDSAGVLPRHVLATLVETVDGLLVGAVAGAAIAALLAGVPLARRVLEPLLVTSQTIPMIVLAPLLVLWFGIGETPKVVVVALITFFPVAISTASGLAGADPDLVELVRSMGASPREVLRVVRVPAAFPSFFAGLRIAAAYAVAGAVIGEFVAGDRGLGVFINISKANFRVDRIFVAVVVVAVLSALLFAAVGVLARLASPWQRPPSPMPVPAQGGHL